MKSILGLVLGLVLLVGCGTENTSESATAVSSPLVGSWAFVDASIGAYPAGSVLTFAADGTWQQATGADLRGGTWTADDVALTLSAANLATTVGYRISACPQGTCLDLAYGGGSTWARQ